MRHNLYAFPHKGLRQGLTSLLSSLDTTDAEDQCAVHMLKEQASELAFMVKNHSHSENEVLMVSLAEKMGKSLETERDVEEHEKLDKQITALSEQLSELSVAPSEENLQYIRQQANLLIPDLLKHMQLEETRFLPLFWQYFSDTELNQLHDQVMASMTPEQIVLWLKYIVPALTPSERTGLVTLLKKNVPSDIFNQLMDVAEQTLDPEEFVRISHI
ncbi:hemerythrin domain-containing protein [Endozoicomonas atrinae]|uniref:hemerythrin domain-containing protein n=1 Tax=Endozoicomonas atrinae TaxID=1333660 RepID=UPI00082589CD|nr:hemerythrin domain-containing protein [Endozoicomonas atrinae]